MFKHSYYALILLDNFHVGGLYKSESSSGFKSPASAHTLLASLLT